MDNLMNKSSLEIAAMAVRTNSKGLLMIGLDRLFASTAMSDYRDIICGLVLFYDAARRLGHDADKLLLEYSDTNDRSKQYIEAFVARSPENKTIAAGGYVVADDAEFRYVSKF